MKITFKNVGAIKETEMDLRPLTVIIGPNNSNKTYLAYLIYGLWKEIRQLGFYLGAEIEFTQSEINKNYFELLLNGYTISRLQNSLRKKTEEFQTQLSEYFQDSSNKIFKNSKQLIEVEEEEFRNGVEKYFLGNVTANLSAKNEKILFKYNQKSVTATRVSSLNTGNNIPKSKVYKILAESFDKAFVPSEISRIFFEMILPIFFPNPFLLPAERNAFVITYKILETRRYRLLREAKRNLLRELGDIRYPEPIEDFLDFLTDVELQKEPIDKSEERLPFLKLADEIEKYIQNQNKTQLKATKMGGKELKVSIKKDFNIDLYNASSSIKQLAPLLLYLRYRAKKNDLLIIDEPEMNLHPESQVKLLEALAILTNLGVSVLLTTHSPYFMSHLNNLVAGNKDNSKVLRKQAKSLYMKNENAFLRMDDVSAYEMKDNQLVSLKDEKYGIRWDTLSDVSVDVQQKYFEIFESGENSHNGR